MSNKKMADDRGQLTAYFYVFFVSISTNLKFYPNFES